MADLMDKARISPDSMLRLMQGIFPKLGLGELVGWQFYYEAVLINPEDEDELRRELRPLTNFEDAVEGDRVFLELELELVEGPASVNVFAKFVVGTNGDLRLEDVLADELSLEKPEDIAKKGRLLQWSQLGVQAARVLVELLDNLGVFGG